MNRSFRCHEQTPFAYYPAQRCLFLAFVTARELSAALGARTLHDRVCIGYEGAPRRWENGIRHAVLVLARSLNVIFSYRLGKSMPTSSQTPPKGGASTDY